MRGETGEDLHASLTFELDYRQLYPAHLLCLLCFLWLIAFELDYRQLYPARLLCLLCFLWLKSLLIPESASR